MPTRAKFNIPFESIKDSVLGKSYELSLVFINKSESRKLNRIYREKNYSTNVLSFPLAKNSGEIFIDIDTAKKESPNFGKTYKEFVLFLFIHALLHLKGLKHGDTMERKEKSLFNSWRAKLQA